MQPQMPDRPTSRDAAPSAQSPRRMRHGELVVDLAAFAARWQGRVIALRPNEFRLLAHFVAHPDRVFSRADRQRYREKVRVCLDVFARMLAESRLEPARG